MFHKSLVAVLIVVLIASCGEGGWLRKRPRTYMEKASGFNYAVRTDFILGTVCAVRVPEDHRRVLDLVFERIKLIDARMTRHNPESEVSRINGFAGIRPVTVSDDTFTVVRTAVEIAEETGGAFDPSIGPLTALWDIGSGREILPEQSEIRRACELVDYRKIMLNAAKRSIYLVDEGMQLDVGGIAKGYASDLAAEILRQQKVPFAIIDFGGNIYVHGNKPGAENWRVGIKIPEENNNGILGVLPASNTSIITSGTYERYFYKDGVKYHHIIQPATGYPADNGLMSVTVVGKSGLVADAFSTAVFLLGRDEGLAFVERTGIEAIIVNNKKQVYYSDALKGKFELIADSYSINLENR